jgi:hypothetical protein
VIGLDAAGGSAYIDNFTGNNAFDGPKVSVAGTITGGGILGLNSSQNSSINTLSGSSFRNLGAKSTGGSISGGGVIGLNAGNGYSQIDTMSGSTFSNLNVSAVNLAGGGVVGLNAAGGDSSIGNFIGNTFTGNTSGESTVTVGGDITGGGILGLNSNQSSFITTLSGSSFKNLGVKSTGGSSISGGGVIGLSSDATAELFDARGNSFDGITVDVDGMLIGGGIIGLNAGEANISFSIGNNLNNLQVKTVDEIMGGGIFGAHADNIAGAMEISDNRFSGSNTVDAGGGISGGGVVGFDAADGTSVGYVSGNTFTGLEIKAASNGITGGGIIGLNSGSGGNSIIGSMEDNIGVSGNTFTGLEIKAGGSGITGGGIIGLNSGVYGSGLGSVAGNNSFSGLKVTAEDGGITGGGIIGLNSTGTSLIGSMANSTGVSGNTFTGLEIKAGASGITGGGIIGLNSRAGDSGIGSVAGNSFTNNLDKVTVEAGGITGGGIIGLNSGGISVIGSVADNTGVSGNTFTGLEIKAAGSGITGGGIIGLNSGAGGSTLGSVAGNDSFSGLTVTASAGGITGGGIIGLNSGGASTIGSVAGNDRFSGLTVTASAGGITGGGIIGLNSGSASTIGSVYDNTFTDLDVKATGGVITGGGIIGLNSAGTSRIDSVVNNSFISFPIVSTVIAVTAGDGIRGGGVLGVYSSAPDNGKAYIGESSINAFFGLQVDGGDYIEGGGIIGAAVARVGGVDDNSVAGIGRIEDNLFADNVVRAEKSILGGLVYSYGLTDGGLEIRNSEFIGNIMSVGAGGEIYGTVTVDTGSKNNGAPNILTLSASPDSDGTVFEGNLLVGVDSSLPDSNSLYFGVVKDGVGTYEKARSDAKLEVKAEVGGTVVLDDPIRVNQNEGRFFAMTVHGADQGGGGEFFWGGDNRFDMDTYNTNNVVNLKLGSVTTLQPGMKLTAEKHDFKLESGGLMNVMGWNWYDDDPNANVLTVNEANLNGNMWFNLVGAPLNAQGHALLEIDTVNATDANIDGSIVKLSNLPAGPTIEPGNMFYLISTNNDEYLNGDPAKNTATSRQGFLRTYTFIIDKKTTDDADSQPNMNKYLVARLEENSVGPAPEAGILVGGGAAGLALLTHTGGWLPDHSYQQADLALKMEDGNAFFAGIDGSLFSVDAGANLHIKSSSMLAGVAMRRSRPAGSFLLGGFFEAGYADYRTTGDFTPVDHPEISGSGYLNYEGIGVMARHTWTEGFRLEGSLRAGRLENHFKTKNFHDVSGARAGYEMITPYFAAHAGAAYDWRINDASSLDFLVRGYWTRQNGKTVELTNGEEMHFSSAESVRLRAGTRYTRIVDETFSWYGGAAYEHEFDGLVRADAYGHDLHSSDFGGGTGIGEIGLIMRKTDNDRLSAELGLQGYVGQTRGISAGIRFAYEF